MSIAENEEIINRPAGIVLKTTQGRYIVVDYHGNVWPDERIGKILTTGKTITQYDKELEMSYQVQVEEFEPKIKTELEKKRGKFRKSSVRKKALEKGDFKCNYCGSKDNLHVDHIHPLHAGGSNSLENLQVLCRTCNLKKGKKVDYVYTGSKV